MPSALAEGIGPEWTRMRICSMQWDPEAGLWTLYAKDQNDRRLDYPFIDPAPSVAPLLRELENDPTSSYFKLRYAPFLRDREHMERATLGFNQNTADNVSRRGSGPSATSRTTTRWGASPR